MLAEARSSDDRTLHARASAILLLILTGCRVSEVLGLHWTDLKGKRLLLRDTKTGPRTVWLGDEAREILVSIPRAAKQPWIFWNWRYESPIKSVQDLWAQVRAQAKLRDVRLHDLRHTFASHAVMGKENLPMIGKLLGHALVASTARYAHFDDDHLLEATETIGAAIERAMLTGSL